MANVTKSDEEDVESRLLLERAAVLVREQRDRNVHRNQDNVVCAVLQKTNLLENLRGGFLMLIRWAVIFPIVYLSYNMKGLYRAPWRMIRDRNPDDPGILLINHSNSLFDVLISQLAGPKWNFFIFDVNFNKIPLLIKFCALFRGIAFPRMGTLDDTAIREQQDKILTQMSDKLVQGHWLSLFPEGRSDFKSNLRPLRYGFARIALTAAAKSGWQLPLRIYVLGLNYEAPQLIASNCYAQWSLKSVDVRDYKEAYELNPLAAEKVLLQEVRELFKGALLESSDITELRDAHKLALQRNQANFQGVLQSLQLIQQGTSKPKKILGIQRSRTESLVYQVLSYGVFGLVYLFAWPFHQFGRLCSRNQSEEATFAFLLWTLCLASGFFVAEVEWRWLAFVALMTWLTAKVYLWFYRRV